MGEENLHKGHRERMRKRFLTEGGEGFADHELLEMLLFSAVPRGDTNALAHKMIREFGSLNMLLESDAVEISRRCSVKESTAILICLQMELMRRYKQAQWKNLVEIDSVQKAGAYAVDLLGNYHYERFYVLCLDSQRRVIHCSLISEGTVSEALVQPRMVVEAALKYRAASVILMHNHPGGCNIPSFADVELTTRLRKVLQEIDIEVADHIIVAENKFFSFLSHDYLK